MKRNGEPSKSDAIRNAIRQARRTLTRDEMQPIIEEQLQQVFGKARLSQLLAVMVNSREISSTGRGDERRYGLAK